MPLAPQEIRTYFVTTVTASRLRIFQVERHALLLMAILEAQRMKGNVAVHGFVIMPDHVHLLLTPAPDVSLEKAVQFIKGGFSFQLKHKTTPWEKSYDSRRIQNALDFNMRLNYIHQNPVSELMVASADVYPWSSAFPGAAVDPIPGHFVGKS